MSHLVVELRSNPHVEVHVQFVVIGDKRTGHGTTWDQVHHGCLNLREKSQ